jgi:hypothetical protein
VIVAFQLAPDALHVDVLLHGQKKHAKYARPCFGFGRACLRVKSHITTSYKLEIDPAL